MLYVLLSRKLLRMGSKRFYTAEEVAAISVADIPWHENGNDVSDDSSSESDREKFHINNLFLLPKVLIKMISYLNHPMKLNKRQ